jgi:hypothetical protein
LENKRPFSTFPPHGCGFETKTVKDVWRQTVKDVLELYTKRRLEWATPNFVADKEIGSFVFLSGAGGLSGS